MRRLVRGSLSAEAQAWLAAQTAEIVESADPRASALQNWENRQNNRHMREVRDELERTASGLVRCMYCEDSQGTDIDHFRPKASFPERTFRWDNHLLACRYCNSNQKRDQFPLDADGEPLLIDPTGCDPAEHLTLTPSTGLFRPLRDSPKGTASIDVFGLNVRAELVKGRKNAWDALKGLLICYGQHRRAANAREAQKIKRVICEYPFSGVLVHLLRVASHPSAPRSLGAECLAVLAEFAEIRTWAG